MSDDPKDPTGLDPDAIYRRFPSSEFPFDEHTSDAIKRASAGPGDDETQVPCPACEHCGLCAGTHMVRAQVRAEHLGRIPLDEIEDE